MNKHKNFIKECFKLALKGNGKVSPNPMVGAVLVNNGKIIAGDFHAEYGKNHAERNLLKIKGDFKKATLYVNLQPCSHYGKTPPCTDIIIKNKIKKVVWSTDDPNFQSCSKTNRILSENNIEFESGVLFNEGVFLNRVYFINQLQKRSYILAKWAQTLDGKIGDYKKDSKFITSRESRKDNHFIRYGCDAILVGINTVINDNPELTVRDFKEKKPITRIVLDTKNRMPFSSKLEKTAKKNPLIIVSASPDYKIKSASYIKINPFNLKKLTEILYKDFKIGKIMVEGGAKVLSSFLKENLIDEFIVYQAPVIAGDKLALNVFECEEKKPIKLFNKLCLNDVKKISDNIRFSFTGRNVKCLPDLLKQRL
ncbi:MAG: bifunctional diaminohydroxyphosphoribosylaminopyrimidine deaminase/5-amino-6-(5-phosphoribosylamino)uracil reductase RibD [Candidatus Muiribacteriota bacterium]